MRQVYTSVAAAACMRDARKTTSRKLGQLLDGNLLFRCRYFMNDVWGSAIITITKVNLHCPTREEGLEKSKCIPPKTYLPNFISNSETTILKGKKNGIPV